MPPLASRVYIMAAVEDSLRKLGTDYVDLCPLYYLDPATPIAKTLRAADSLQIDLANRGCETP
jgi:aryl-alcohol dehydrogenase-like predicted oxidoreductase